MARQKRYVVRTTIKGGDTLIEETFKTEREAVEYASSMTNFINPKTCRIDVEEQWQ